METMEISKPVDYEYAGSAAGIDEEHPFKRKRSNSESTASSDGSENSEAWEAQVPRLTRLMLKNGNPKIHWLGLRGRRREGQTLMNDEDEYEWEDEGIQILSHALHVSYMGGLICGCVEPFLRRAAPLEVWRHGVFSEDECEAKSRHEDEARWILSMATQANRLYMMDAEDQEYQFLTVEIIRFVFEDRYPAFAINTASTELDPELLPEVEDTNPGNPATSPVSMIRIDITVNLDIESSDTVAELIKEVDEFPTPFCRSEDKPIILIDCRSQDSLDYALARSTACASALLESWRTLGDPIAVKVPEADLLNDEEDIGDIQNLKSIPYPKTRVIPINDRNNVKEVGIDHVVTIQVVEHMWFYTIVFIDPAASYGNGKAIPSRGSYGHIMLGDMRTPAGLYDIVRFLEKLIDYKVSVWLTGMLKRKVDET